MRHIHLQVFGRVQGVGFRYFTQRIAMNYNIVGTVQNVDDYVEIYAQGDDADIEIYSRCNWRCLTSIKCNKPSTWRVRTKSKIIGFSINIKC